MQEVTTRQLQRYIERKTKQKFVVSQPDKGVWVFASIVSHRTIGIIDRGTFLALHDDRNPLDTKDTPTAMLTKGKKIRQIRK